MLPDNIKLNTDLRDSAGKNECNRTFFKMINNAPYWKTIENVVKRTNIKVLPDMENSRRMAESTHASIFGGSIQTWLQSKTAQLIR